MRIHIFNFYLSDKKGGYIKSQGMKGFSIWPLQGDKNNTLLTAISSGMGIQQCS